MTDGPFEPLALLRDACHEVVGGAQGCLAWIALAEREIERDPEHCHARILRCAAQNRYFAEHGAPAFIVPANYYRTEDAL